MARKFDLNTYETVKERKAKFYKDHPTGRIIVELMNPDTISQHALFKALVYEDKKDECPKATGYAMEIRDVELSVSNSGSKYESVNYTSWTENAEESAVGRALDNAGYSGNKKCSREEMEKSQRNSKAITSNTAEASTKQIDYIKSMCKDLGSSDDIQINASVKKMFGKDLNKLNKAEATRAISELKDLVLQRNNSL